MGIIDYVRAVSDACAVAFLVFYALRRHAAQNGYPKIFVPKSSCRPVQYFVRLSIGYLAAGIVLYALRYAVSPTWMDPKTVVYDETRFGLEHAALSAWIWTLLFAGIALTTAQGAPHSDDEEDDIE